MIENTLTQLGLDRTLLGYSYLQTAIKLLNNRPSSTMQLYTEIATKNNTTVKCVEHACRYTIHECWLHRDIDIARNIFGNNEDVPTVGKFIKKVSRYLKEDDHGT